LTDAHPELVGAEKDGSLVLSCGNPAPIFAFSASKEQGSNLFDCTRRSSFGLALYQFLFD
jgi:hypothetical protein